MMRNRQGMAMPVVMSLIVILVLIAMSVASTGIATLNLAGANHLSRQSVFAAEAGLAAAFREIIQGNAWTSYTNVAYGRESRYSVQSIVGPSSVVGQPDVPAGAVYLLATGTTRGRHARRVGVLIEGAGSAPAAAYGYAISTGGELRMQGGGTVAGSLKSNQDLQLQGGIKVVPFQGSGRMLSGQDIDISNGIKRDPSQDLRARQQISIGSGSEPPNPVKLIFPNDATPDSAPFIADGRFTNTLNVGEVGEILPNPDPVVLLGLTPDPAVPGDYLKDLAGEYVMDPARTDVVPHSLADTAISSPTSLNLAGKIHFFPGGISFSGNGAVTGPGTIVAGAGKGISIQGNHNLEANLLALRWPGQMPSGGNPTITIQGNTDVKGLILAHEDVDVQGNFHLTGMIVAYRPNGGDFDGQGNRGITFDSSGLALPGLQTWQTPPGGPVGGGTLGITPGQPLKVLSWQRL
ncbi:hypothetical protein IV102_08125 [bacterium]|nr:hypothetical protein [bacterium]